VYLYINIWIQYGGKVVEGRIDKKIPAAVVCAGVKGEEGKGVGHFPPHLVKGAGVRLSPPRKVLLLAKVAKRNGYE
jgi:hypothetical protein